MEKKKFVTVLSTLFRALEELIANFNKLTSLPDTIGFELTNIRRLSVNSNKLSCLPSSTSHMITLRSLDVHLNCLRSLPDGLENLSSLQSLDLSQNFHHLTTLPPSLGLLSSLSFLDVSYNSLAALPDSLGCLSSLADLRVDGNPLVRPPKKVIDSGIQAVREYLNSRLNREEKRKPKFGVGRFVRCVSSVRESTRKVLIRNYDEDLSLMNKHKFVEGFATPTRWTLSPRRLFGSPRK